MNVDESELGIFVGFVTHLGLEKNIAGKSQC